MSVSPAKARRLRRQQIVKIVLLSLLALVIAYGIYKMMSGSKELPKRTVPEVVQLKLLSPPPPPPPPPKPVLDPPKIKEPDMKMDKPLENQSPAPKAEAPPGPAPMGAGDAGAGNDGFGLAGGNGGMGGGGGGGGGGSRFGGYYAKLESCFLERLKLSRRFKELRPLMAVQVWVATGGRIDRVELAKSSGHSDIDKLVVEISNTIGSCPGLPEDMPRQPTPLSFGAQHSRGFE